MNLNYSDYIEIKTDVSNEKLSLLIDSQADVCIIKQNSLKFYSKINTSEKIEITGVVRTPIYSLGTIDIELIIGNTTVTHKFHIMPNNFNIPSDGIIGKDFNKLYNCILDYGTQEYTMRTKLGNYTIPINMHTKDNFLTLPPRAETTRIFRFATKKSFLIKAKELQPGVMTSNSIASDGVALIQIINCTNTLQKIKIPEFEMHPLENYKICSITETKNTKNRTNKIIEILSQNFPKETNVRSKLTDICSEYADIFAIETDQMTVNNFYKQDLNINDKEPVYTRNYRTPHTQKQEINRQVKKLLENDLIENSSSNYNSPIILVPKKGSGTDKKWRMCIDYRKLNKKLVADRYPLPRIDDILDKLGRAKYFSIMDLFSGFHQVPLNENSRDYTTFSTENGSYRWKVLPFGLNISPNSFSRMMNIAFSGLPPEKAFLYIDDIIVIGRSENEHIANLESVFKILRERNLKLNPEKCKFFQEQVTFLGHKCTSKGILPDETKLKSINNYPKPHDKDSVKRFVAFANYYRKFIPSFAEIAKPLSDLTRKREEFRWTEVHQKAFEKLKNSLISPKILQYPDFEKQFIIKVDASSLGCAGVLLQEKNGIDMPIAYFSKTFQKGEKNKAIIEKELLAIYHSINQFRPYIYNTKFIVYTDHKPLVYLYAMKNPASKLVRIKLELEEYDFDIIHIKGKDNIQADALSRIPFSEIKSIHDESKQILAITRSMTRKMNEKSRRNEKTIEKEADQNENINVYEELRGYDKKKPRLKTQIKGNTLRLQAYWKHKDLFQIDTYFNEKLHTLSVLSHEKLIKEYNNKNNYNKDANNSEKLNSDSVLSRKTSRNRHINNTYNEVKNNNEKLHLGSILSRLEKSSIFYNQYEYQMLANDRIFKYVTMESFKEACMKNLKNVQIAIVNPVTHITDENERMKILNEYHYDRIRGGHCGQKKLYAKIRSQFYWPKMTVDIAKFVRKCDKCIVNKPKPATREPMALTPTPQKAFDCVIMDTIGPMQKTIYGNSYAITLICDLTKYLVTIPVPNKEANTVAKAIFENFILIYGTPKTIRTDLGTEYKNEVVKELCALLNIEHHFSTAYHHESLGTIERNHRIFNEYIRAYSDTDTWDILLRYFTYCFNTSFNGSLNHEYTPFELVYGKKSNEIRSLNEPIAPVYNFENYTKILKHSLQKANERAKFFIEKLKKKNKEYYDKKINQIQLKIGDLVLVKREPYDKFKSIFSGPYKVKQIETQNVTIEINNNPYKIHKNRIIKM